MAGIEKIGKVEEDEAVKLSVELKEKLALEENQKLAKQEEMWRKLEEEIEYYKRIILKKVESTLISEDHAPYYRGGVDQIRWINEGIRKDDKLAKRFALNLLRNLLQKHGITRGYIKCTESDVPLDFLKLVDEHISQVESTIVEYWHDPSCCCYTVATAGN